MARFEIIFGTDEPKESIIIDDLGDDNKDLWLLVEEQHPDAWERFSEADLYEVIPL